MRDIKFRGWDSEMKEMYNFILLIKEKTGGKLVVRVLTGSKVETGATELMQYTGLKDKNGREIYEGDIVKVRFSESDQEHEIIGEIFYDDDCKSDLDGHYIAFCIKANDYDVIPVGKLIIDTDWHDFEVIGNIYENEDLLKGGEDLC